MSFRKPSRLWITTAVATSIVASGFASVAQAGPARPIGLNEATPSLTENVRYKRRYVRARRGNAGAAVALGVLGLAAGAAIAASRQNDYYDDYPGYYAPGPTHYYGAPGYYAPQQRYYAPRYAQPAPRYVQPAPRYYGGGGGCPTGISNGVRCWTGNER